MPSVVSGRFSSSAEGKEGYREELVRIIIIMMMMMMMMGNVRVRVRLAQQRLVTAVAGRWSCALQNSKTAKKRRGGSDESDHWLERPKKDGGRYMKLGVVAEKVWREGEGGLSSVAQGNAWKLREASGLGRVGMGKGPGKLGPGCGKAGAGARERGENSRGPIGGGN